MSVAAGGGSESAVSAGKLIALGLVGGLLGIYATPINPIIGPLCAAVGAVLGIVWGADAIRRVASYGLGTGVPSIGYMSLAIGIIGSLTGLGAAILIPGLPSLIAPIFGVLLSIILGAIVALLGTKIVKMKIPILVQCTAELSGAAAISLFGFSAAIAGSFSMAAITQYVIATGIIGLLFIMNTMAIQHPFNACLGPNENQTRTLKLAASTGFMSMAVVGLLGMLFSQAWWVIAVVGAIAWFISIRSFIQASIDEAASVKWTGMWPKEEEQ